MIITTVPTTTLRNAEAWLALLAPRADLAPIRLPTRVDAATPKVRTMSNEYKPKGSNKNQPMPNGMVFRTKGEHNEPAGSDTMTRL